MARSVIESQSSKQLRTPRGSDKHFFSGDKSASSKLSNEKDIGRKSTIGLRKPLTAVPFKADRALKEPTSSNSKLKSSFTEPSATTKLRHSFITAGPKSTQTDEVDEIYSKPDPIDASLQIRKTRNKGNV